MLESLLITPKEVHAKLYELKTGLDMFSGMNLP
jgi:hypothetical protein